MGTIILTHFLTSLNNLLFTYSEERFIQGRFYFFKGKFKDFGFTWGILNLVLLVLINEL
ncbi:hypothetical protein [Sporosarcina sp. FSL K6-2383]|uniref:hypothetical protein n=1 Tax=Sporosarcina sp. FSL K6-2383 TaxID=2921556 RepID=UPI00315B16AF